MCSADCAPSSGPPPMDIEGTGGGAGADSRWAYENHSCSAVWTATATEETNGSPRSRPARHHAPAVLVAAADASAHQGTVASDISTCPRSASSTQTAANTTARVVRRPHPALMAAHPRTLGPSV
ncbi:hypothetical protein [Streptomyces achromogenes]|uniref:hypothetical protein n=1 Tax=Streptomyces achromogenes TaxID=67255 RepID=UPI003690030B